MPEAFDRMRGQGLPAPATLAAHIRRAAPHTGTWPRLSVWQGSADTTVDPANADAIARSWALLQGLGAPVRDTVNGQARLAWRDAQGATAIESITIAGMGHGTPIAATGAEACGTPGAYMLDAGISSTRRIAAFWDIAPAVADGPTPIVRQESGMEAMINGALRQAGLLR
jgi:poly(3-hydroxybutyrate) depolymerase